MSLPCATTQFPIILGRGTHHHYGAGLILQSPSLISISTSSQPPRRDTRSLRPASDVVSSSRKAGEIGRRVGLVRWNSLPSSGCGSIGSCGGDVVVATDGGGDVMPPSCGGGRGGGGRGGEEESSNAGGGDRDLSLMAWVLKKLKKIENDPYLDPNMAFKSFRELADYIGRVLRLLISTPEGAVLSVLGVAVEDNSQCPSPCDSFSSMSTENLQCPSSFGPASSRSGDMSPMGVEGRDPGDNCDVESRLTKFANCLPSYRGSRTPPDASSVRNPAVNRTKGFLGAFYTIAEKLFMFCAGLLMWSLQYAKSQQGIIIASAISLFLSCILAPLASYTKEAESVYGAGMEIFKWLFLVQSLGLSAELCAILRFYADTPMPIPWTLGIVSSALIVLIWVWVFYVEVRQEQMGSLREESRMLLAKPESECEPDSTTSSPV